MKKFICLILLLGAALRVLPQASPAIVDSLKKELLNVKGNERKFEILSRLSRVLMTINPADGEKYGLQLIAFAEGTRDRRLMTRARLANGERCSYLSGKKENLENAIKYYNAGLALAKENKLDDLAVSAYLSLSEIHRVVPDPQKALNFCNQAYSYSGTLKDDSLSARVHLEYGMVYLATNDKLLALRNLMKALQIAEEKSNYSLLRLAYLRLCRFYSLIEEFDKAIDYQVKAYGALEQVHSPQTPYSRIGDLNSIGDLYASKKNFDIANAYYEQAIALADSMKFEPIKANIYSSIVTNYINAKQPRKALDYFNSHPQLPQFLRSVGFPHFIDQSYGYIYSELGDYDSAKYYYGKVAVFFQNDVNTGNKLNYYYQLGVLHQKTGELDKSLSYFLMANDLADKVGDIRMRSQMAETLDSLYILKGDYKQAVYFGHLNAQFKDSLNKLGKEKDLLQIEAADEQQRQDRIAREKEEKKHKRDSIQYMGITIGIAALFIFLVMLGMFRVSVNTIKAIGFFVFLMFFEFIFLIFKKNIYSFTKGEPWKDLMFMIILAAILLPLHHWLEHRVIGYLTSHNRLTSAGNLFKTKFLRRVKDGNSP